MKSRIFFGLLIFVFTTKIWAGDPCKTDFKNQACFDYISSEIFFAQGDGKLSLPHKKNVEDYYKKFGYEGFLFKAAKERTLAEELLVGMKKSDFKMRFIKDFPKGQLIGNKNIFDVMLGDASKIFTKVYVNNLEILFPAEGNEDLKYTNEQFGLPWDDPKFLAGYLKELESEISEIEQTQEFFKDKRYEDDRLKYKKILDRLKPFAEIPQKVCQMTSSQELKANLEMFPAMFKSPQKDIVGCLLKNNKCSIAKELIDSGNYIKENLVSYFNQLYSLKGSAECAETAKIVYLAMVDLHQKTDKYYQNQGMLKDLSGYLEKHPEVSGDFCQAPTGGSQNNILSLEKSFLEVMNLQAHDLLKKMIQEKDPKKQDELLEEFVELLGLMPNDTKKDPRTNKSLLETLADAGAHELLGKIFNRGINSFTLDDFPTMEAKDILGNAIESDDLNKLKFAFVLYNERRSDDSVVYYTRSALKRFHSKDPLIQEYRNYFKEVVREHYLHIY